MPNSPPPKKTPIVAIIFASILVAGILTYFLTRPKITSAGWFNDSWSYRNKVPVTNNTTVQTNVYVNMTIDTSNTTNFQSDCGDLRFTTYGGNLLQYFVSSGCTTSNTVVHVQMQTFPAGLQDLYYYYGNPSASNGFVGKDFPTQATNYSVGTIGSQEIGQGPVSYWKFDEGYGNTVSDSNRGNANNGTLSGTNLPTWQTEDMCVSGKCLKFDGSTTYISVPDNSSLEGFTKMSICAWGKLNAYDITDGSIIINKSTTAVNTSPANPYILYGMLVDTSGKLNFDVSTGVSGSRVAVVSATTVSLNQWHYMCGVYNGSTMYQYIDGIQDANTNSTSITVGTNSIPLEIGAWMATGYPDVWNGFLDDIKLYPFALTSGQILANYNSRGASKGTSAQFGQASTAFLNQNLVGYWKADESSGNLTDSSGNGNSLTNGNTPAASFIAGKFGNSISLNGSQWVGGTTASVLNITGDLTLSSWIYTLAVAPSTQYDIITKWDKYLSNQLSYNLAQCGTELCFFLNADANYIQTSGANLAINTWYHVTAVYHAATATATIYLNGLPVTATINGTIPTSINSNTARFELGVEFNSGGSPTHSFSGQLDDIRVYSRALSDSEVNQLYNWAPGPVGYWKMDENTGNSVYDSSGNSLTGTWNGTLGSQWVTGKYGAAGYFNSIDNYVYLGTAGTNFPTGASPRTVSLWFKFKSSAVQQALFSYGDNLNGERFAVWYDTNRIGIETVNYARLASWTWDNNWHYFAAVYPPGQTSTSAIQIYIDGVSVPGSDSGTPQTMNTTNVYPKVGCLSGASACVGSYPFGGSVDEIRVYNYARTAKQIVQDMNGGHPSGGSPVGSQLGYWKMDEGYGNTTANSGFGGLALNGTLSGVTLPTWTNNGKFNKALNFSGSQYVNLVNGASIQGSSNATIDAWIYPTTLPSSGTSKYIYSESVADNVSYNRFSLILGNNNGYCSAANVIDLHFRVGTSAATGYTVCGTTALTANTWYHVVGIFNSGTGVHNVYVNGVLDGTLSQAVSSFPATNPATPPRIGRDTDDTSGFSGIIDEVKLYNYALTADDVKIDYNRGSSVVLGSLSDTSQLTGGGVASNSANAVYCIPGDNTSCTYPLAEWKFDENTGNSAYDVSGNNHTGTWNGATQWIRGKYGSAGKFDGSTSYVNVGNVIDLSGNQPMTVEAWIYPLSAPASTAGIVTKYNAGVAGEWYLAIDLNRKVQFERECGGYGINSVTAVPLNQWTHVVGAYDAGVLKVYINGVLDNSASDSCTVTATTANVRIGADDANTNAQRYFNGTIDNAIVYNYARSQAQVAWDYNRGAPVAWYKFDECQGTTAYDSAPKADRSGSRFDGNITIGTSGTQNTTGTCTGNTTSAWKNGANGKYGSSLNFDGTDDYVDLGSSIASLPTGTNPRTVSLWFKINSNTAARALFSYGDNVANERTSAYFINGTPAQLGIEDTGASVTFNWTYDTNWHLFTAVFPTGSTTLGSYKLYLDGVLQTNANNPSNTLASTASYPKIACLAGSSGCVGTPNYFFSGQLDDIRIYNYALTATQVNTLYNQGSSIQFAPISGPP